MRWLGFLVPSVWCLAAVIKYWKELFKGRRPCFISQSEELQSAMVGKAGWPVKSMGQLVTVRQSGREQRELQRNRGGVQCMGPTSSDPLPSGRLRLLKVPQSLKTVPWVENQGGHFMSKSRYLKVITCPYRFDGQQNWHSLTKTGGGGAAKSSWGGAKP